MYEIQTVNAHGFKHTKFINMSEQELDKYMLNEKEVFAIIVKAANHFGDGMKQQRLIGIMNHVIEQRIKKDAETKHETLSPVEMEISSKKLARLIINLERKGLIARKEVIVHSYKSSSHRMKEIYLTEKGKQVATKYVN
jgi:hypothetical protein